MYVCMYIYIYIYMYLSLSIYIYIYILTSTAWTLSNKQTDHGALLEWGETNKQSLGSFLVPPR